MSLLLPVSGRKDFSDCWERSHLAGGFCRSACRMLTFPAGSPESKDLRAAVGCQLAPSMVGARALNHNRVQSCRYCSAGKMGDCLASRSGSKAHPLTMGGRRSVHSWREPSKTTGAIIFPFCSPERGAPGLQNGDRISLVVWGCQASEEDLNPEPAVCALYSLHHWGHP